MQAFSGKGNLSETQREIKRQFPDTTELDVKNALEAQAKNTVSVCSVKYDKDGEVEFSKVSYLKAFEGDDVKSSAAGKQRFENKKTAISGSEGIPDKDRSPSNQPPPGQVLYLDMTHAEKHSRTLAGKIDPLHSPANICAALIDDEKNLLLPSL